MRFEPNKPIETTSPRVVVDAGLDPGAHRFQLVVVDTSGLRSQPTEVTVTVVRLGTVPVVPPVVITGPIVPIR